MTSLSWPADVNCPATGLRSLLAERGGFFSRNPELVSGELNVARVKMLAVVLLELHDHSRSRWVVVEQGPGARRPGCWKFPGNPIATGHLPLTAAIRSVTDNIALLDAGLPLSWQNLACSILSVDLDWLTELSIPAGESKAERENTLVFTFHARMQVADVDRIELRDLRTRVGLQVWAAGISDIQRCINEGSLCSASAQLWGAYWQRAPA